MDIKMLTNQLDRMAHHKVENYVVPGLNSELIAVPKGNERGLIRRFKLEDRHQYEFVFPHSHRYHFTALVLTGKVTNRVFKPSNSIMGDFWVPSKLQRDLKVLGKYEKIQGEKPVRYEVVSTTYGPGDTYAMAPEEIHSIYFARGTEVLIFEGPTEQEETTILEPYANGQVIKNFRVDDWMFKREGEPLMDPEPERELLGYDVYSQPIYKGDCVTVNGAPNIGVSKADRVENGRLYRDDPVTGRTSNSHHAPMNFYRRVSCPEKK